MKRKAKICSAVIFDPKAEFGRQFYYKCKHFRLNRWDGNCMEDCGMGCTLENESADWGNLTLMADFEDENVPKGCRFKLEHKLAQGIVKLNI